LIAIDRASIIVGAIQYHNNLALIINVSSESTMMRKKARKANMKPLSYLSYKKETRFNYPRKAQE